MSARLVNVRLDEDRLRKARMLRAQGVTLSDVVRDAIDERFDQMNRSRQPQNVKTIIRHVFEQYPDPADMPPRGYDVHDRKAARAAIIERLRRSGQ